MSVLPASDMAFILQLNLIFTINYSLECPLRKAISLKPFKCEGIAHDNAGKAFVGCALQGVRASGRAQKLRGIYISRGARLPKSRWVGVAKKYVVIFFHLTRESAIETTEQAVNVIRAGWDQAVLCALMSAAGAHISENIRANYIFITTDLNFIHHSRLKTLKSTFCDTTTVVMQTRLPWRYWQNDTWLENRFSSEPEIISQPVRFEDIFSCVIHKIIWVWTEANEVISEANVDRQNWLKIWKDCFHYMMRYICFTYIFFTIIQWDPFHHFLFKYKRVSIDVMKLSQLTKEVAEINFAPASQEVKDSSQHEFTSDFSSLDYFSLLLRPHKFFHPIKHIFRWFWTDDVIILMPFSWKKYEKNPLSLLNNEN